MSQIKPFNPPPPVNFVEWDGLVRLAFQRKNKTLQATLCSKTVLQMLENNYRTAKALNNEGIPEDQEIDIKSIVQSVLDATEMGDKRSAKLSIQDFLKLLAAFNEAGIHFA